jgi:hypothetical protein
MTNNNSNNNPTFSLLDTMMRQMAPAGKLNLIY